MEQRHSTLSHEPSPQREIPADKLKLLVLEPHNDRFRFSQHLVNTNAQSVERIRDIGEITAALQIYAPDVMVVLWDGTCQALVKLLRKVRSSGSAVGVPVVVGATCGQVSTKIAVLDAGADQYVVAPWAEEEFRAHVHASLHRKLRRGTPILSINGLQLDVHRQKLTAQTDAGPRPISLTPQEFRLLHFLVEHPLQVHTRADLLRRVWTRSTHVGGRTVDAHIRKLRVALAGTACDGLIHTVYGEGYRLALDAAALPSEAHSA